MTRKDMIQALTEGKKITHKYFGPEEFFQMDLDSGAIFTEDGYNMGGLHSEFMEIRKGGYWEYDWKIYES